jgi:hypothetical protein
MVIQGMTIMRCAHACLLLFLRSKNKRRRLILCAAKLRILLAQQIFDLKKAVCAAWLRIGYQDCFLRETMVT